MPPVSLLGLGLNLALGLLLGCKGYHSEPFVSAQYGELDTTTPIINSDTEGWTVTVGANYVSRPQFSVPVSDQTALFQAHDRIRELEATVEALRSPPVDPVEEAPVTDPESWIRAVAESRWTWPSVAALAIVAVMLWIWVRRRRKNGAKP